MAELKTMKRHFTTTVYIIENDKVLLIQHRKIKKWLPPGGHLEPDEIPSEAAIREAFEETGLHIELQSQDNLCINQNNAISLHRPYLCLLENIHPYDDEPAHQHIDMVYVGKPIGGTLTRNDIETTGLRWFTLDELEQLEPEVELYIETLQTIKTLLKAEVFS